MNQKKKANGEPRRIGKPPKKQVDFALLERLCQIQCTMDEIESVIGIDVDTISARCKEHLGITFSDFYKQKRKGGKASLRRQVWKRVSEGSDTMIIWATKNYLGMSDKQEVKHELNTFLEIEKAAEEYDRERGESEED